MSEMPQKSSTLVVTLGESLIDQVVQEDSSVLNVVGGSPLNTALALSRQGIDAALVSRVSDDVLGGMILKVLHESRVDVSRITYCSVPTTRAIATPDGRGGKKYEFDIEGTTQGTWEAHNLDGVCNNATYVVVTAALAAPIQAMRSAFDTFMNQNAQVDDRIFVFDPNVRPALIDNKDEVRAVLEKWISQSTVVKASADDVLEGWPGLSSEEVAQRWLDSGVGLVVITDGDEGAHAFSRQGSLFVEAVKVDPALGGDTIGAGDTFTAGLIKFFIENNIRTATQVREMSIEVLREAIVSGTLLAGETCKRVGANPPWKEGLQPVVNEATEVSL